MLRMRLWGKFSFRHSDLWTVLALVAVYVGIAQIGLLISADQRFDAAVWSPAGIGLAAVLLLGYHVWPGLALGSFLVGITWLWKPGNSPLHCFSACACMAAGTTLESLIGGWLVNRFAAGREAFRQPQTILLFVAFAAVASLGMGSSAQVAAWYLAGIPTPQGPWNLWLSFWLGSVVSAVVITPLVLLWSTRGFPRMGVRRSLEGVILVILSILICAVVFGESNPVRTHASPLSILVIPALLWSALRFGQRGTALMAMMIAGTATIATLRGHGPFFVSDRGVSLLLLQNFLAVISVMSLILAADVSQRQSVDIQLGVSEQRYRDLFESNPQPLWVYAYDTLRFLAVNESAIRQYGYSRAEFLDLSVTDLSAPESKTEVAQAVADEKREESQHEWRQQRKDGAVIDVEATIRNIVFDGTRAALVLCSDITERKRSELHTRAFSEVGRRLSAASTAREAAQIVMGTADLLFGWDACLFILHSAKEKDLTTVLAIDTIQNKRKDVTLECFKAGSGSYLRAALEEGGRLILRPSPAAFASDMNPFGDTSRPSASLMFAPVRKEREAIALISIQSYRQHAYNENDLRLFQALADHCGSALERIRAEDEVQRLNRELRHRVEELETIFNVAPVGLAVAHDPNSHTITSNPACAEMLGLPPSNGSAPAGGPRILRNGRELPMAEWPMQLAAAEGKSVGGEELSVIRSDGKSINCYIAASPLYDEAMRVRGSLGVFVDLTERKRAEEEILRLNMELEHRVRDRTAQLEAINKELEAFSYSVSHDLRAPLRSIRGFSEVVLERYANKLDARGQEFLRRACESSQQMDRLIEDLLKLSRVSRNELQQQQVNLSHLVEAIASELRQSNPQRSVDFRITPGLTAQGDERLLRIVLENLLRNCWKFTSKRPDATIIFGHDKNVDAFFVQDNGAGFDMAHSAKLFGVFQRLHSLAEFPGTGVGLATVQRIINRHGGRVWANAEVGEGATFYFTLPDSQIG